VLLYADGGESDLTGQQRKGKGQSKAWEERAELGNLSAYRSPCSVPFPFPIPFPLSRPRLCHSLSPSVPLQFVMTTPHVIASSSTHTSQSATTTGVVGNHFRVGKKIGEGSFGVVFEGNFHLLIPFPSLLSPCPSGANLLTNQPVAIKFVSDCRCDSTPCSGSRRCTGTSQVGRTPIAR
jgi:hypothetical protein